MLRNNLEKLIFFKTVAEDHKENKKALNWIKKQVKKLPVYIKEFNSNGFASLVITTQKTKEPIIWLAAHLDVAPASDKMFIPFVKNDKLYGRGAFDMKFAIACYLKLFIELGKNLSDYNLGLMITTDEETDGENGTKFILNKGYSSKICFLPDVGASWKFENGAKAAWRLSVQSKGRSAHGSKPWQGKNAVENLIKILYLLEKKFPTEPCGIKDHYHNSINIGKIQGGESANKVAGFAEALVDIRLKPEVEKFKIKKIIDFISKKIGNIKVKEISFKSGYKENFSNNYYFQLFSSIAYDKFRIRPSSVFSHGTSDICFFNEKKIPVILVQPKGGGHHSNIEWIDLKDLKKFYLVLKEFIQVISRN